MVKSTHLEQMLDALEHSHVTFPYVLFSGYHALGLTEREVMVIVQILACQQQDGRFPDLESLQQRMGLSRDEIAVILQRLTLSGLVLHENQRLSIRPLLSRVLGLHEQETDLKTLFQHFENEFGRLLSPLELEQIESWRQDDQYPAWLIVEALRESVLSGVYKLRYVDTVLREWNRAHIRSEKELADHRAQYRGRGTESSVAQTSARTANGKRRASASGTADTRAPQGARVLPAVQPGKYDRFYQIYKDREEAATSTDGSSSN